MGVPHLPNPTPAALLPGVKVEKKKQAIHFHFISLPHVLSTLSSHVWRVNSLGVLLASGWRLNG
nr:hypothetical protein Q903MT_gene6265 [Picea sitchensis]